MVFSSVEFLFFFLPFALLLVFISKEKYHNLILLILSIAFYGWGEPKFLMGMIISILWNYILALLLEQSQSKQIICRGILAVGIVSNLSVLFLYKYLDSVVYGFNVITKSNYNSLNLLLPLGISFFLFQEISYLLDVYYDVVKAEKNIVHVGLYITFFPKLLMGPIMRYRDFYPQLTNRTVNLDTFSAGIKRFIIGMVKKSILSLPFGVVADDAFGRTGAELPVILAWFGVICYCLQLYFDFSGYSDMAIGLGKMFGFQIPENFEHPYMATSVAEYWRRWHITLGVWFRDYLYTPLFRFFMQKKNPITHKKITFQSCDLIALGITWCCTGIWHGAGLSFLLYGIWYFLFIALERIRDNRKKQLIKQGKMQKRPPTKQEKLLGHVTTLLVVFFGQLLFRATNIMHAVSYFKALFGLCGNLLFDSDTVLYLQDNLIYLVFGIVFCTPIVSWIAKKMQKNIASQWVYELFTPIVYGVAFITAIAFMVSSQQTSFIYFQF